METVSKVEFVKINALNEQKDEAEIVQGPTVCNFIYSKFLFIHI